MDPKDLESTIIGDAYRHVLGQTVHETEFSEEGTLSLCNTVSDPATSIDPEQYVNTIHLTQANEKLTTLFELGIESLPDEDEIKIERFKVEGVIGEGGTSRVYRVYDEDLGRFIAIKRMMRRSKKSSKHISIEDQTTQSPSKSSKPFLHEARMTAQLEHPNILPIYDVGQTEDGQLYLSMRHIDGTSLGDLLRDATTLEDSPIGTINDRTTIFLKVCDAIAYAHNAGICHQDIKPDNIMLGQFGEVLVVDWGTASMVTPTEHDTKRLIGTPVYMSPEQARREKADERSDIYCLGGTLFHLLTFRWPMYDNDAKRFWQKKRAGHIDQPTEQEWRDLPSPLLNIALKAMAVPPEDRYPSVQALIDDVKAFQAGAAVSAYKEGLGEFLWRYTKRHRAALLVTLTVLLCVLTIGGVLYELKLKTIAHWGINPTIEVDFADNNWDDQWVWVNGQDTGLVKDGKLTTTFSGATIGFIDKPLVGNIAFEMQARMLPGYAAGDLSFVYFESYTINDRKHINLNNNYYIQTGARGNTYAAISTFHNKLNIANHQLIPGKTYLIRGEVVDNVIRLFADGKLLCEYEANMPFTSGYVGIYTFFPGKQIDRIRVYNQGPARHNPPTIAGDAMYKVGNYEEAIRLYSHVVNSSRDPQISAEAQYKLGLVYLKQDDIQKARGAWKGIQVQPYIQKVKLLLLREEYKRNLLDDPIPQLRDYWYTYSTQRERTRTIFTWKHILSEAINTKSKASLEALLAFKDELFPDNYSVSISTIQALSNMDRYQTIVDKYPNFKHEATLALLNLGRYEEVLQQVSLDPSQKTSALINLNRSEDILADPALNSGRRLRALEKLGRYETILKEYKHYRGGEAYINTLQKMGRYDEIIRLYSNKPKFSNYVKTAYKSTGRYDEMSKLFVITPDDLEYKSDHGLYKQIYESPKNPNLLKYHVVRAMLFDKHLNVEGPGLRRWKDLRSEYNWLKAFLAYTQAKPSSVENKRQLIQRLKALHERKIPPLVLNSSYTGYLIYPLMALFEGVMTEPEFISTMQDMINNYEKRGGLVQYHDGKYLLGEINDDTYLKQPYKPKIKSRLLALHAIQLDRAGKTQMALAQYKALLAKYPYQRIHGIVFDAFIEWRIFHLKAKSESTQVSPTG